MWLERTEKFNGQRDCSVQGGDFQRRLSGSGWLLRPYEEPSVVE